MNRTTVLAVCAAITITFGIEEFRAFKFMKEAEKRINDQSVRLAALSERLEMLEN